MFDNWYEYTVREIEEKAGILPPDDDQDEITNESEEGGPLVQKEDDSKAQRSGAPSARPHLRSVAQAVVASGRFAAVAGKGAGVLPAVSGIGADGAERVELGTERADLAASTGLQVAMQADSSRFAVGLVFMEDKTLGFPRVFVRDVVPGGSADQSSRLKRGDLLVLIDNEDIYGRDLDYVAAILPGAHGSFVRLGFANVDRSFIEIDLQRTTPISSGAIASG